MSIAPLRRSILISHSHVNNAGISVESRRQPLKIHETTQDDFDRTIDVNVRSIFLACKYVIAQMVKQEPSDAGDRGWIINMSSIFGLVGGYNNSMYRPRALTSALLTSQPVTLCRKVP